MEEGCRKLQRYDAKVRERWRMERQGGRIGERRGNGEEREMRGGDGERGERRPDCKSVTNAGLTPERKMQVRKRSKYRMVNNNNNNNYYY